MVRLTLPMSLFVISTLLSGCMPGSDDATPLMLTPGPTSTQPRTFTSTVAVESSATVAIQPWPENCEPEQVTQFVARFMDAFNRGDVEMLRGMLPDADATPLNVLLGMANVDPATVDGIPVALDAFSMPHNGVAGDFPTLEANILTKRTDEVLAFAAASHAAGVRLHLRNILHAGGWLPTTVTFGMEATLEMPGQADVPWLGKAGIDCEHQRLVLWSIGPDGRQFASPTDWRLF